jgi:hypothetical protein
MKCNKSENKIIGYLLKTLSPAEFKLMTTHLSSCKFCKEKLEEFQQTDKLLKMWKTPDAFNGLAQEVLDRVHVQQANEPKPFTDSFPTNISFESYIEALRKIAVSEQLRVYTFLTELIGKEKGEEAFDVYLEEQMKLKIQTITGEIVTYEEVINLSTGEKRGSQSPGEVKKSIASTLSTGTVTKAIKQKCLFPSVIKDFGISINPCETVCRRQIKVVEKLKSVRIERTVTLPYKDGGCVFLIKPMDMKK